MSLPTYPAWDEMLERVCKACEVNTENAASQNISRLELAQAARNQNRCAYFRELRNIFKPAEPTHRHHLLAKLPFQSYLTTNYDSLILEACRLDNANVVTYSEYPAFRIEDRRKGEVFFLHGRINPTDLNSEPNIVLTENDFNEAYETSLLRSFLEQLLTFHNLCFLGCSLEDVYLQGVFRLCRSFRNDVRAQGHSNNTRWFILLDQTCLLSCNWEEIGIEPVYYDKVNSDYDGLRTILDYWVDKEPAVLRPLGGDGRVSYKRGEEVPHE